jgi:hypothetical protein
MGRHAGNFLQLCYKQGPHYAKHAHFLRESPLFTSPLRCSALWPHCEDAGESAGPPEHPRQMNLRRLNSIQRMGASRSGLLEFLRQRRRAPTADAERSV